MTNNYSERQYKVRGSQDAVTVTEVSDLGFMRAAIGDAISGDKSSSSGISSRRISGSYTVSNSRFLMKATKFAGMNRSVLGATGARSRPTSDTLVFRLQGKNEFCFNFFNAVPIKNSYRKWISNSDTNISKEQGRFLDSYIDRENQKQNQQTKGEVFSTGVLGIGKYGKKHAEREKVSNSAVNAGTTGSENKRITASFVQSPEWSISHE